MPATIDKFLGTLLNHSHQSSDISGGANTALSNLASVAINTSLISDTDSTDDLGSSSIFWANAYIDKIYLQGTTYYIAVEANRINISAGGVSGSDLLLTVGGYVGIVGSYGTTTITPLSNQVRINTQSIDPLDFSESLQPTNDSTYNLGTSALFWDETYTDEIVLSNVGAAAAAADTIRLAAYDISADNTSLDIRTEGTGAVLTGQADSASSVRVKIRVNGVEYQVLCV